MSMPTSVTFAVIGTRIALVIRFFYAIRLSPDIPCFVTNRTTYVCGKLFIDRFRERF